MPATMPGAANGGRAANDEGRHDATMKLMRRIRHRSCDARAEQRESAERERSAVAWRPRPARARAATALYSHCRRRSLLRNPSHEDLQTMVLAVARDWRRRGFGRLRRQRLGQRQSNYHAVDGQAAHGRDAGEPNAVTSAARRRRRG